jgi:hypothetical protein
MTVDDNYEKFLLLLAVPVVWILVRFVILPRRKRKQEDDPNDNSTDSH